MAKIPLYDSSGVFLKTQDVDLDAIATGRRENLVRRAVIAYEANRRQGTVDTKERGEIKGAAHKPWRQKGTGRARAGSRKSPIWRSGGTIFGPHPRDFRHHMPSRARRGACASALRGKIEDGEAGLIEALKLDPPKTRVIASLLSTMGWKGSVLIATEQLDPLAWRCARNIPGVTVLPADQVNAEHLVRHGQVLMTPESFERLRARIGQGPKAEVAQ